MEHRRRLNIPLVGAALTLMCLVQLIRLNHWFHSSSGSVFVSRHPQLKLENAIQLVSDTQTTIRGEDDLLVTEKSLTQGNLLHPVTKKSHDEEVDHDSDLDRAEERVQLEPNQDVWDGTPFQGAFHFNKLPVGDSSTPSSNLTIFTTHCKFQVQEILALISWIRTGADVVIFIDELACLEGFPKWGLERLRRATNKPWILKTPRPIIEYPLLNATFTEAERISRTPWLCYTNADIILPKYFVNLTRLGDDYWKATGKSVIFSGVRFDCDEPQSPSDYDAELDLFWYWKRRLICYFHGWGGKDYFVFKRHVLNPSQLPPLRIGAEIWDSWFLHTYYENIVEVSPYILALHMEHYRRESPKRFGGARENARLSSCNEYQRKLYDEGAPYKARTWRIFTCLRNQQLDKMTKQLCPVPGTDRVVISEAMSRADYAVARSLVVFGIEFTMPQTTAKKDEHHQRKWFYQNWADALCNSTYRALRNGSIEHGLYVM